MSNNSLESFWNLLNNFEDSIIDGIKKNHPEYKFYEVINPVSEYTNISSDDQKRDKLLQMEDIIENCKLCGMSEIRSDYFIGKGSLNPKIMIIQSYKNFDNSYNDFLKKWIEAIDISFSKECYLASIVKCVTKDSTVPTTDEIDECFKYLDEQISIIQPKIIFALGRSAAKALGIKLQNIEDVRGKIFRYKNIDIFCTYHPAQVLQNVNLKRPVWEDLKKIKAFLG